MASLDMQTLREREAPTTAAATALACKGRLRETSLLVTSLLATSRETSRAASCSTPGPMGVVITNQPRVLQRARALACRKTHIKIYKYTLERPPPHLQHLKGLR